MRRAQALAWVAHAYTMLGGVVVLFGLFAAAAGDVRLAFILIAVQALIDGTDGILARRLRVKDHLPNFDGAMVDNVIDFLAYIWLPLFIAYQERLLPSPVWIIPPLLAALYAYGQTNMKSDDGYFIGFPSLWNVVVLYLYWLRPTDVVAVLFVLIPSVLSFVPTRYIYPSRHRPLVSLTFWTGIGWCVLVIVIFLLPAPPAWLILISLAYPVWYILASFVNDYQIRKAT